MLTVLHASDLQCGRPFVPRAADALVTFAHELRPDVMVVSGDLTQRAKVGEFQAAAALLERLPEVPLVVTPGNHDVPVYRIWERLATPYRNWRTLISRELDSVTHVPGAVFVALNSSAPWRAIVNGRVRRRQVDFARRALDATRPEDVRALVIHHHFVPTPDGKAGRPLPGARRLVHDFESMGADMVLGGHVHETHVHTSRAVVPEGEGAGIALIAAGTATSRRGRGAEVGVNSVNVVRVGARDIEVVPHLLPRLGTRFEPVDPIKLGLPHRRGGSGVPTGGSAP